MRDRLNETTAFTAPKNIKSSRPKESSLVVKDILVFEESGGKPFTTLQFFADGYPGLIFHITPNGQRVQPQNQLMPTGYLYGQGLLPVELHITGNYRMIVFQLFPFVISSLFGVNSKELTDSCFDLQKMNAWRPIEKRLAKASSLQDQVDIIAGFLATLFQQHKHKIDLSVKDAINLILRHKGQITVKEICSKLHVTARTLERRFMKGVGISAKDFIQVTKFQQSLEQLTLTDHNKVTDIVYNNGFADQSHFIRVFKSYTGQTPLKFKKNKIPRLS